MTVCHSAWGDGIKEDELSLHARPHLETHRLGSGHSAVDGVAYRLGLRLLDRRTGIWHDYRKRQQNAGLTSHPIRNACQFLSLEQLAAV